jgi:hypothetical protein
MNENIKYFRRLDAVAKQIVDDGSADADTAAAFRTATMELASQYSNPEHALKQLYAGDSELSSLLRQAVAIVTKDDDGGDEIIEKARSRDGATGAHGLAAALSEHLIDRLDHLRRKHGFEKKESTPMESIEKLKAERKQKLLAIGKAVGDVAMAKIMVAGNDARGISKEEYTEIVTVAAQRIYPNDRPDSAFSKRFSDTGPDGVWLRKGYNVVKLDAMNEGNDHTESSEAYDELTVKADEYRKAHPELSQAQAFSKVFTNPANAKLASKAHVRPSAPAGGAYPHPR